MPKLFFVLTWAWIAVTVASNHTQDALLQTWNKALDGSTQGGAATDTPVTRVVNLLKEMQGTLKKEMDEDEELYEKLSCWCNNNEYEKKQAIEAAKSKIAELESLIESLIAKTVELKTTIKETQDELEADKNELAEATALRNKQLKEFQGEELDAIQNIENLKAAIMVLGKHHGAFPQISFLSMRKRRKGGPFGGDHENQLETQLDAFMRKNDFDTSTDAMHATDHEVQKFLQQHKGTSDKVEEMSDKVEEMEVKSAETGKFLQDQQDSDQKVVPFSEEAPPTEQATPIWTVNDKTVVEKAIHSASCFLQAHGRQSYTPPYAAQSGEILGVLKQLKEEMEADLSEAQKTEVDRAAAFKELREAKTAEIAAGEKQLEEKKAELAQAEMDLANGKEDLDEVQAQLSEDQKFIMNLQKTCEDADTNFEIRKKTRLAEIQAVSQTIEILTADDARDTFNGAFKGFVQLSSAVSHRDGRRAHVASALRLAAAKTGSPQLSVLASSVELDAFTKVKKMIDEMIATLKHQQAEEVKKKDWCDSEMQENEMQTMKTETLKTDQQTQIENLGVAIKTLTDEIEAAKAQISEMQINLQRASENRAKENLDFQKTIADQKATQEILAKALDKLATFYDKEALLQKGHAKQAPPVPQIEYKKSAGAEGVMSMIEKLIYDSKQLEADSVKGESEAQSQYETLVEDTNASVADLQKAVVTKTESKAQAEKELTETKEALEGTISDLENLAAYLGDLHQDCDYILKNFGIRQQGRAQEIEALQQAKQILSGAMEG